MHTINKVLPQPDFSLLLTFDTGEERYFDVTPYLTKGVFVKLQDYAVFSQVQVADGTIIWPGNIDLCPTMLFERSTSQ